MQLSTAYHPQTDGQTKVLNRCLEGYLRCMIGERPQDWVLWIPLAEWWYNTTYHSTIRTTPYEALYGQRRPLHQPYLAGSTQVAKVDRSLQAWEVARNLLKFQLNRSKDRMKQVADRGRSGRVFHDGNLMYLRLQPYKQHSLRRVLNQKLSPRYYGPFPMVAKVGAIVYRLSLPEGSRIHPTFHVSLLKKHVEQAIVSPSLPLVGTDGSLPKEPVKILECRMVRWGNHAEIEVLVEWANSFPEDATWENFADFYRQYPSFDP